MPVLCLVVASELAGAGPADALPIGVRYLTVTQIHGVEAAINNAGEIVYVSADAVGGLISTRRGQLTTPSLNVRFPDINSAGEVVYTDLVAGYPGLSALSTERGYLFAGNLLSINDFGDIVGEGRLTFPGPAVPVMYGRDGSISQLALPPGVLTAQITNAGELTYLVEDSTSHVSNLYSSTRGQLTFFTSGRGVMSHATNNNGEFIYTARDDQGYGLFGQDGTRLWDGPLAGIADLNDFGDVVFNVPVTYKCPDSHNTCGSFAIVLMTSRPDFFAGDAFVPYSSDILVQHPTVAAPEPSSIALFALGGLGLLWSRRPQLMRNRCTKSTHV